MRRQVRWRRGGLRAVRVVRVLVMVVGVGGERRVRMRFARAWMVKWSASMIWVNVYWSWGWGWAVELEEKSKSWARGRGGGGSAAGVPGVV